LELDSCLSITLKVSVVFLESLGKINGLKPSSSSFLICSFLSSFLGTSSFFVSSFLVVPLVASSLKISIVALAFLVSSFFTDRFWCTKNYI